MDKKITKLPKQKASKKGGNLLSSDGGELDKMMMGSLLEKMQKGGDARRVASKADGTEKLQEYKIGGWTHS